MEKNQLRVCMAFTEDKILEKLNDETIFNYQSIFLITILIVL